MGEQSTDDYDWSEIHAEVEARMAREAAFDRELRGHHPVMWRVKNELRDGGWAWWIAFAVIFGPVLFWILKGILT